MYKTFTLLSFCLLLSIQASPLHAQSRTQIRKAYKDLVTATKEADLDTFVEASALVLKDKASRSLPAVAEAFGKIVDRSKDLDPGDYFKFHSDVAKNIGKAITPKEVPYLKNYRKKMKHPLGRMILLEAANFSKAWDIDKAALEALEDKGAIVVKRSLFYLRNLEKLSVLEAIMERYLEVEKKGKSYKGADWDRTRLAFQDALTRLLKVRLNAALDYQSYLEFRKHRPDLFNPKQKKDGISKLSLFGAEVTGKNLTFIIDISGSMMATDPVKKGKNSKRGGTTVGDPRKDPKYIDSRRRINRARKELVKVVKNLPDDVRFNIIPYSTEVSPWKKSLTKADSKNKKAAIQFIEGLKAEGVTFTDEALEIAFSDLSVDTVFLITDGAPTHQGGRSSVRPSDADAIITYIHKRMQVLNFLRGVRVFTLGFPEAEEEFLKKLSKDHSGNYTPIE